MPVSSCHSFQVATGPEGLNGILRQSLRLSPIANHWTHVSREGVLKQRFRRNQIAFLLRHGQFLGVDQRRFREELLSHGYGLNHGFNLAFEIVALIDHVCDISPLPCLALEEVDLVENSENLIRIDRTQGEIVVRITPVVKVKAAKHLLR